MLDLAPDRDQHWLIVLDRRDEVVAGMSAAVAMTTLDQSTSGSGSIATRRACASVERIVMPNQAPGKTRSSVYLAAP
jgi:hypothetical protein